MVLLLGIMTLGRVQARTQVRGRAERQVSGVRLHLLVPGGLANVGAAALNDPVRVGDDAHLDNLVASVAEVLFNQKTAYRKLLIETPRAGDDLANGFSGDTKTMYSWNSF